MRVSKTGAQEKSESRRRLEKDLEAARIELFEDARLGAGGRQALHHFSERIDELLRHIFSFAHGQGELPLAVVALGGYGRRLLCPYSDVDFLILFDGKIGVQEENFSKALLHPLWDLRLDLGHQVRELEDFRDLESDNPEFVLALLDARLVAGDPNLYDRFQELFHRSNPQSHRQILDLLLPLIEQRHARFNNTFYQLEPDVKEAPGGLWDMVAARWIQFLTTGHGKCDWGAQTVSPLSNLQRLDQAEDFLLRIRIHLHRLNGRNHNVLTHALQEKVADSFGYTGLPHQQVEILMSDYFRHARAIARFLDSAQEAIRPRSEKSRPRKVGENLERAHDEIRFRNSKKASREPASWLQAFRVALNEQCQVSDTALSLIERNLCRYNPDDFFPTEAERDFLLDFLHPRQGLYERLSEMHDCGFLGGMFPEFQSVFCRVIRDFYHKYTVDEHTLLTIRNLERLVRPSSSARGRFSSILQELDSPELLVLSLLFHDVGKWRDENHVEESARMVQNVFRRLHLSPDSARRVQFLIENHLQMSLVAFRRDTEDAEVVRRFAALVGTEENLKMLCLMTLADIEAVSPETLTPWKEELIWQLYVDTYNQLTLAYGDEVIEKNLASVSELLADHPADLSASEISSFLEGFPRRYLKATDKENIYRHVRLSHDIHPDEVHLSLAKQHDVWELTVVTLDKPYLFSNISGVLSYFGMDILRGQAMTNPKGLILDIFQFTDHEGFFQLNPEGISQFECLLQDVVSGKVELPPLLQRKERGVPYRKTQKRVSTMIVFDNQYSQRYTILEIVTQNALGLLYRISRAISRHRYDIDLVLISTEGDKAIDVFHITGKNGRLSELSQRELKSDLLSMLEGIYEADQEHCPSKQS
ncbi:MAG: [protein-PII] uridylyltransferase [Acidobacteria bacterium]|nr:[protein-PII] uridylyltransferase [Acidobacteriota bacterium]